MRKASNDLLFIFLSTPSGWRATPSASSNVPTMSRFLSTPSGWRATVKNLARAFNMSISIHALRVEGDCNILSAPARGIDISIHALRVEGD